MADGDPAPLGAPRQRALLAVLLTRRGTIVSTDELIEALWGEATPASALKIVQGYVSSLRRAIGEDRILTRGHGYELRVAPGEADADRFEELLVDGRAERDRGEAVRAAATRRRA